MNEFKFSCPHCDQHLQCDEQFSGREIQCPACDHLIRIPAIPGKTVEFNPESGKTWATFVPNAGAGAGQKKSSPTSEKPPIPPLK
jgi:hypothetical protein